MSARRKILLIDDSPIVRAVVVHTLSAAGLEVSTIDDPRALGQAITSDLPDLLLVDATFPNVTDDQLIEALGGRPASLPIVLFSDRPEAEIRVLATRCGAQGFVPKDGATLAERLKPFLASS